MYYLCIYMIFLNHMFSHFFYPLYHFVLSVAIFMLVSSYERLCNVVDLDKVEICGILYIILFFLH